MRNTSDLADVTLAWRATVRKAPGLQDMTAVEHLNSSAFMKQARKLFEDFKVFLRGSYVITCLLKTKPLRLLLLDHKYISLVLASVHETFPSQIVSTPAAVAQYTTSAVATAKTL